jgi:hypothetical protein
LITLATPKELVIPALLEVVFHWLCQYQSAPTQGAKQVNNSPFDFYLFANVLQSYKTFVQSATVCLGQAGG